jgi:myo-inositol 2-dehydrogenase/D-chiro-inositol 1-dehydrogenase
MTTTPPHLTISAPIRVGLVGCGRLAERGYVPALQRLRHLRLAAVADAAPARCKAIAPGVPVYSGLQEMLEAGGLDAVLICTPTRFHVADACLAAKSRLLSLVEKPPGTGPDEAAQLMALTPAPRIAFNRRFDPAVSALRRAVPAKTSIELRLELQYRRKGWDPFDMHDDALLDLGPHLIDLASWITGERIHRVRADVLTFTRASFTAYMERSRARIECLSNRPYRERIVVTAGGRRLAHHHRGGVVSGLIERLRPGRANPLVESLVGQLEAFALAVRGEDAAPLGTAADGFTAMSAIQAVRASAAHAGEICPVD